MTQPLPVPLAPASLEAYAQHFDALFAKRNQRDAFRHYVEGLAAGGFVAAIWAGTMTNL